MTDQENTYILKITKFEHYPIKLKRSMQKEEIDRKNIQKLIQTYHK